MKELIGTGVALITPFDNKGKVDYTSLSRLVNYVIKGKAEYVVALGTTAESVTLTNNEKQKILDCIRETVNKRVPIVVGMGGNNTSEIISACKKKEYSEGALAYLSVSPYYNKPSQRGIYEHYKAIAKASPLPIILYNVPGRTSSNIIADTTLRLAKEFKNIVGVKEASGNIEQCMKLINHRPSNFLVISGDDLLTLPLIAAGANGVISVVANAFPNAFSEMVRLSIKGDMKKARVLHYQLADITEQLFADGNPAGIKSVLSMMKLCKENLRLPLMPVNGEVRNKLSELLADFQ